MVVKGVMMIQNKDESVEEIVIKLESNLIQSSRNQSITISDQTAPNVNEAAQETMKATELIEIFYRKIQRDIQDIQTTAFERTDNALDLSINNLAPALKNLN